MTNRQTLEIVEIDIERCALEFGTSPCTASAATGLECFNTLKTCQDEPNFDEVTYTLRFSKNQKTGIPGQIIYPALRSTSTNATRIALGSGEKRSGTLGKRARITVNLSDFKWGDVGTDPYVNTRTYDPLEQGTFFGKLRARFPYYWGRALRVKTGVVGDALDDMQTAHYIITGWTGPDENGAVKITAQDPLKLADEEYALAPRPSNGRLAEDIEDDFLGEIALTPATVGDEYASEGRISIGSEIMRFTRSGDVLTITERAVDGSEASSHSEGDTAQECLRYENALPEDVHRELLRDFASIDNAFLPYADWQAEIRRWQAGFRLTRTIVKPTPVRKLVAQILDLGQAMWWDEEAQEIKLRANRPPDLGEAVAEITEAANILDASASIKDLSDQRYDQVWIYHGVEDYADDLDDPENYKKLFVAADPDNPHKQTQILQIFSPWLGQDGDDVQATTTIKRLLARYLETPREISIDVDAKDKDDTSLASLVRIRSKLLQDEFGASVPTDMQVVQVEWTDPGHLLRVFAQQLDFTGRFGFFMENDASSDYNAATDTEKEEGAFFVDEATLVFPDGTAPYEFF